MGDAFNENKFNKNFDDLKTDIVNNAGTYKQSEAPLVKNVVDTFNSKLMNFDGKNEEKFNFDWGKNYQKTLDKKAEKEKAEKQAQEQIIKDKITDKSEIKFYSANYDLTAENVLDTLKSTLDNEVLKAALKSYAVDECHLSETSFNNIYSNAIDDTAKYYEAEIKKSEENTYSVAGKEVFDILIEKFNEKIQKALKERNEGLIKAADTGKITGYGSASYNKVDDIIDNLGKADGVLGTRLHTWANGQYGTISDGRWKTLYDQAIEECKKEKFNKDTNGNYAVKDVVDKFLEKLGNILSGYDFSQVDYTTLQDYKNNKKISGKIEDWNNFSTIYLLYKKAGEALYEQLKTVNAIKTYIETKFGVKISDTQLEDIMKSIIDIATLYSNDITINSATGDWSYESKTLIDKFNSALIDYVKNNNPQTKVYTTTDLAGIDYNGEYKDCFTAVDRGYKLNLTKINEKFKDYIEKVGSILNLVDVKSAINWNKIHSQEITNKEGTLMNSVGSSKDTKVSLQFKINSNGSITFVNKDSSSVFQDTKNNNTDTLFNTTLKNGLFTTYSSELTALFGDDKTDKDNLFNLALKMALSSDKFNLYDDIKAEDVIKLVNDYFVKIMLKIQNSNEAMEYVKNYNFEGSYLNGKTTSNLSDIYTYGSTGGNDDWVAIEETTTTNKHIDEGTTTVNYIHIEQYDDNDASKLDAVKINDAMDKLFDKYIERYVTKGNYFDIKAVVEYFAKAQTSAISKLKNGIESDDKSVYKNIYGYGNNDQYDTYHNNNRYKFVTVQAVLIQIMFEMEALINNAILLDGISVPSAGSTPPTSSGSSTTSSGSSTTSSGSSTTSSTPSTGTSDNATSGLTDEEINEIFESNKDETYNSLFHVSEKWYNINDLQDIFNKLGSNKFNLLFEPKSGVGNMQQYCLRSGLQATINGKTYNIKTVEALRCAIDNGFELKHETYGSINYNQ